MKYIQEGTYYTFDEKNGGELPGSNPIGTPIFNLYKNPREDRPQDAIQYGVGFGGNFVAMLKSHMAMKQKYPVREPGRGLPYGGIENLRPETKALVQSMAAWIKPMRKKKPKSSVNYHPFRWW